jgi:hypothetical protein
LRLGRKKSRRYMHLLCTLSDRRRETPVVAKAEIQEPASTGASPVGLVAGAAPGPPHSLMLFEIE